MSQLLRFNFSYIFSLLFASAFLISCDKDMTVSLGNANEDIAVSLIDSFSVNSSTYQLTNMPSAATGLVLVGKVNNPDLGSINSSSYLKVSLDAYTNTIPEGAVFDSVNVVLKPNSSKYYYGDTTQNQTLSIHRVTEEIVTKNILTGIDNYNTPIYVTGPTIFNTQKFDYDNVALGALTFKPYVRSTDTLSVKLNNNFGKEIFDMVRNNNFDVSNEEAFQAYLKGFVIVPNANNTVILGMSDTVNVNINYTYIGTDGFNKTGKKVISTSAAGYQHNNIEYDRSGTTFATLNETNRELKSTETNNKVYVQSGTGLVTKISIPSLNEFMSNENISVNKAELIIETEGLAFGSYAAPSGLMLMIADKNGLPVSYIPAPFSTTIQQVPFISGNDVGLNGRYIFNLIDYIKYVNTNRYRDTDLLISTLSPAMFNTVNTLNIATENGKPKIKLNIVYTKFK